MKKPGTLRRLLGYIGRSRFALIGVFVFALIGNAALLLAPKLIGEAIDLILPAEESFFPALLRMLAVIGVLYLLGLLFNCLPPCVPTGRPTARCRRCALTCSASLAGCRSAITTPIPAGI